MELLPPKPVDDYDLLLTPTIAEPPPELGSFDSPADNPLAGLFRAAGLVPFTPPFNVTGQPGISLPLHWNGDGLPIGVQLVGAYGREDLLIRVAAASSNRARTRRRRGVRPSIDCSALSRRFSSDCWI